MADLLFKNARVIDPSQRLDSVCDLLVKDGRIEQIGQDLTSGTANVISASGLILAPGLIDLHVHLRDPGFTDKEDIISGCEAAAAGGVTTLCAMPNTNPVCDNPETIKYIIDKSKSAKARVLPIAAVTKGQNGEELTDMQALKEAGACAFSDDGVPVKTALLMEQAMATANSLNMPIFAHCEERMLAGRGIINKGLVSKEIGVEGIPDSAEDVGTARELALLMSAPKGTRLHICHVSTKNSVNLISAAKQMGLSVTAETGPHYFTYNEDKVRLLDADYRMNPPLRTAKDQVSVLYSLADGTIDAIATDHAPHTPQDKSDFYTAPNGVIGMETSFSASYTALVASGIISVSQLIRKMSTKPAKILGKDLGGLRAGMPADLILIDENEKWTVDVDHLHGKSKNCIYKGCCLQSKIKMTVFGGKIVYNELGE